MKKYYNTSLKFSEIMPIREYVAGMSPVTNSRFLTLEKSHERLK